MKVTKRQLAKLVLESTDLDKKLKYVRERESLLQKSLEGEDRDHQILYINDVIRGIIDYLLEKSKVEKVT